MKKIFVIFLAVVLSFAGISSISASDKLFKIETESFCILGALIKMNTIKVTWNLT